MPCRRRLAAVAAASLILALGGCKIEIGAGSGRHHPGGSSGSSVRSHSGGYGSGSSRVSAGSGELITEPGGGFATVYRLIGHARRAIDLTIYELSDTTAEHDLAAAARRGVRVRVVLDRRESHTNSDAYHYLRAHRVKVTWSSSRYTYTHQKTLVIDRSAAVIMTANLTSRYYSTSRDFLVVDRTSADVAAITRVFDADFAHKAITPRDGRDLVWSPTDSQRHLLALINGARKTLRIYSEEMSDSTVEDALIRAAHRGVAVRVCGENQYGEYDSAFARLAHAGVRISYYSSSSGFYIHAKVIEADYGTRHARAFIGSENFSETSLDRNRELGLIISSHPALASIAKTFAADFRHGRKFRG